MENLKLSLSALRNARRRARLTLHEVAERIGVTDGTAWKYENGRLPLTTGRLLQLIGIYGCSVEDVIVKEDD